MQKCSYCGRENAADASNCCECGTPLNERPVQISLITPHRMLGEVQKSIWEHFAVKRRQLYIAGFLIGAFGALIVAVRRAEIGFLIWLLPVGGAVGVGAVWIVMLLERLQSGIITARARGESTGLRRALLVLGGFLAILVVALALAVLVFLCTH